MKNYIQDGTALDVIVPAAVVSGQAVLYGKMLGVHVSDAALNEETVAHFKGVHSVPKVGATAMAFGAELYWDDAAKNLTTVAAGNTFVGYCAKAALAADTHVNILLKL